MWVVAKAGAKSPQGSNIPKGISDSLSVEIKDMVRSSARTTSVQERALTFKTLI